MLGAALVMAGSVSAGDIVVHKSGRYFQDATGKPFFFIGYYSWASVAPGYYNNSPQTYTEMILKGAPHNVKYVRFSLGINALGGKGTRYWEVHPTPTPFVYERGKANLDKWNPEFWNGLKYYCAMSRTHGVVLHVCLFDGVDFRGGKEQHRWINSFWNVKNQTRNFYGDLDLDHDGNADVAGEFYRLADFKNNTGVGKYQRKVIDKALAVIAPYDNVFLEIGNELMDSPADWNDAVAAYVRTKTKKAITQSGGKLGLTVNGFSEHNPDTPAMVRDELPGMVGYGCPAWLDPDGSRLMDAGPDDLRRSAWYSFAGGAAGWGGFNGGYWSRNPSESALKYFGHLDKFIRESGIKFWEMRPWQAMILNTKTSSCLVKLGKEYLVYALEDPKVWVNLNSIYNKAVVRIYNPKTGVWGAKQVISGGGTRRFDKPAGMDDWVIYIKAL